MHTVNCLKKSNRLMENCLNEFLGHEECCKDTTIIGSSWFLLNLYCKDLLANELKYPLTEPIVGNFRMNIDRK